jgi:hypothetical protein
MATMRSARAAAVPCSEYWRIVAVDGALEWAVFYYSGAAAAAGITYRGALICTASGMMPEGAAALERVNGALALCGIRPWEMFQANNSNCGSAPLSVPPYGLTDWLALQDTIGKAAPQTNA